MKAFVYDKYGSPDNLKIKEIEKPIPKENEVLVKIVATSINASDWEFLTGTPLYSRIFGLFKPGIKILGSDIAGRIEAVGSNVKSFQPGDEVFGDIFEHWGGFAEYVCAPENKLLLKPASMSFEEATTILQAGVVALQGIRDKGKVQPGQKVLINGAGGSSGTFALQLAQLYGAEVTGVDNAEKLDLMSSLGAIEVIDYTKEDFTRNGKQYDLILDMVAYHPALDYKRALNPTGRFVMVGGSMSVIVQVLVLGWWISFLGKKKMGILAHKQNKKDISHMVDLFEEGKIKTVIDRRFPLSELPQAMQYFGDGHAKGKIVITT